MNLASIQAAENKLLLNTYERNPYLFVSGKGVYLRDENGNRLPRSAQRHRRLRARLRPSGHRAGHRASELASAAYLEPLLPRGHGQPRASPDGDQRHGPRLLLQQRNRSMGGRAEARPRPRRPRLAPNGKRIGTKFLALEHSFHGRTMGSVATTHKEKYRLPFAPVMPDVEFVRFNDVADLRAKFSDDVCGICIEPIQGEGGIHPVSQEFFAAARELCDSTGALLLADEIQSGLGRTGKWFAYQHYGIQPDVTTLAKPIANGIPMGAMLCTEKRGRGLHARHAWHHLRRRSAGLRCCHRRDRHDAAARTSSHISQDVGRLLQVGA